MRQIRVAAAEGLGSAVYLESEALPVLAGHPALPPSEGAPQTQAVGGRDDSKRTIPSAITRRCLGVCRSVTLWIALRSSSSPEPSLGPAPLSRVSRSVFFRQSVSSAAKQFAGRAVFSSENLRGQPAYALMQKERQADAPRLCKSSSLKPSQTARDL